MGKSEEETVQTSSLSWEGDLLDRKQYAEFLTNYIERKIDAGSESLVLALDAPWGLGKSFFVQRWSQDLREKKHGVVVFDAWENDSTAEPVVSFMAELRESLSPLYAEIPRTDKVSKAIVEKTGEVLRNLRRAALPVAGVMGKAILKKSTGIVFKEMVDAATGDASDEGDEFSIEDASATSTEALEKSLDTYFEKALDSHNERAKSVKAFKTSLEELLQFVNSKGITNGPLYVFVDELDRCRPDYAIKLLEGIKHLFNVRGVVFIVSTNIQQLSRAVGAVYGVNFNGQQYLKRFFDFEFSLPTPPRLAFIRANITKHSLSTIKGPSGLDPALDASDRTMCHVFAAVSDALDLDLRSILQTLTIADAIASSYRKEELFCGLWLFFIAAIRHKHPDLFDLIAERKLTLQEFQIECRKILTGNSAMPVMERNNQKVTSRKTTIDFIEPLNFFYSLTLESTDLLKRIVNQHDAWETGYPMNLAFELFGNSWRVLNNSKHAVSEYSARATLAGHVSL